MKVAIISGLLLLSTVGLNYASPSCRECVGPEENQTCQVGGDTEQCMAYQGMCNAWGDCIGGFS